MNKEWAKNKKHNRSAWGSGPWDTEPDYYEWITSVGYPAFAGRLQTGAWYGIVEAPHPLGIDFSRFIHTLCFNNNYSIGSVSKTDIETIGQFTISFEHWEEPNPDKDPQSTTYKTWNRGPYRTLEDLKTICEKMANDILSLNNNPNLYKDAF